MKTKTIEIAKGLSFGGDEPTLFIAGPCVIESRDHAMKMGGIIAAMRDELKVNIVFKASYDKANRTSIHSFRGPGIEEGLRILAEVKREFGLPLLSDIHETSHARPAGEVLDIIQIPAFLCRQTDLIVEAVKTGRAVGVKKGQFLSPEETKNILDKGEELGSGRVFLTERGTSFGYQNLVVDMRSFPIMRAYGQPVVYDITHSMQRPGGAGTETAGTRQFARPLARAVAAAGVDGFFLEVHDNPPDAKSDRATQLDVETAKRTIREILAVQRALAETGALDL